jgi:hypothetical protein
MAPIFRDWKHRNQGVLGQKRLMRFYGDYFEVPTYILALFYKRITEYLPSPTRELCGHNHALSVYDFALTETQRVQYENDVNPTVWLVAKYQKLGPSGRPCSVIMQQGTYNFFCRQ